MVHAGVQLFFVLLSFIVVICSMTGHCLRAKQALSHQPVAVLAVGTPLGELSISLQRPFLLWM